MCQTKKQPSAAAIVIVTTMSKLAALEKAMAPPLERNARVLHFAMGLSPRPPGCRPVPSGGSERSMLRPIRKTDTP